jgi:hypothetical protein
LFGKWSHARVDERINKNDIYFVNYDQRTVREDKMSSNKAKRIKRGTPVKRRGFKGHAFPTQPPSASIYHDAEIGSAHADKGLRAVLLEKASTALQVIINKASKNAVVEALRAPTPFDSLVTVTSSEGAVASVAAQVDDPLRAAKARAAKHLVALFSMEGGPIGVEEVSERLGISRAAVDKRRHAGTLIGISDRGRAILYPSWQFTDQGLLAGLQDVLRVLDVQDPWMRMQFFLTDDPDLGATPLDMLRRGRQSDVVAAAKRYGHQGDEGERSASAG